MGRRIAALVVLLAAGPSVWTLTSRVATWGDEVAASVDTMLVYAAPATASTAGGLDFVEITECMGGCLPGSQGFAYGLLALLLAGGPLAFASVILERRQQQFGGMAVPTAWGQAGFVLQGASLVVGSLLVYAFVSQATTGEVVHWSSAAGVTDVLFGVPALFRWRRLQAGAFAAPGRPLLNAA